MIADGDISKQYCQYMIASNITDIPASWVSSPSTANGGSNGVNDHRDGDLPISFLKDKSVRTVFGPVPLRLALDWPVFASYDELAGCAAWMGGRIPTFEEAKSIYAHVENMKHTLNSKLCNKVPAVNG